VSVKGDMDDAPSCPKCSQGNVYPDGDNLVCADCGAEWSASAPAPVADDAGPADDVVRDANGVELVSGDAVVLIKSLKLKGSATTLKQGTKITGIRVVGGDHALDCRVDNMNIMLKAEFVRKV